jgi:fatty-acyl-CoA synthase
MQALMMDAPLTLDVVARRFEEIFPTRPVVSRRNDRVVERSTWGEVGARARRLSAALAGLGIQPGDRVATLAWNHQRHLEAYFGIPGCGAVLHTLNLRLHPRELEYIIGHAGDAIILVDECLLPLLDRVSPSIRDVRFVVMRETDAAMPPGALDYEDLLASADTASWNPPVLDERHPAAMCYTTGTTGAPKGVVYSHRSTVLHAMAMALPDCAGFSERDVCLPVVPMFHVNAWGFPFAAALVGSGFVLPGPHLDAVSLLDLFQSEGVTMSAGVPTILMGILAALDAEPARWNLKQLDRLIVGGAAVPAAVVDGFQRRHGITVLHAWGMTETSPLGTIARLPPDLLSLPADQELALRTAQGRPAPLVELRIRGENEVVAPDGRSMGELEIRGPWIASSYYNSVDGRDAFTDDGWLRTGDIATIDERRYVRIQDRAKDLVKSGGEWISSIALENALMGHAAIAEAAVIAIPHEKWGERPAAIVTLRPGMTTSAADLRSYLTPLVARWWLPEDFVAVATIPRTSTGKFKKLELRAQWAEGTLGGTVL